jgi:GTP-binding protein EngB required for normal cell division
MGQEEKGAYEKKMEARLRELDAEMELLRAKADKLEADAQQRSRTVLDDLREQRDRAAEQLDSYRKAAGSALGEVQHGLETAVEAFADGVKRASDRFEKE